jgi:predicted RecB family nuclease
VEVILREGREVGVAARNLFPSGALVEAPPWEHARAVTRTQEQMSNRDVPAIFEAAFEREGVRIRADLLERRPGGKWSLLEVKSSTSVKESHLDDVALQQFVLERSGVEVASVELVHVNRSYVRGNGGIHWPDFFHRADVTAESSRRLGEVPHRLEALRGLLAQGAEPDIEPGRRCFSPHGCEFWDYCTAGKPDEWIFYLPALPPERLRSLETRGIDRISQIPEDFGLSDLQRRVRESHRVRSPYISPALQSPLDGLGPPAFYLDFETLGSAIPPYPATRPYHILPFQWSLHYVDATGSCTHRRFLAEGRSDPRRAFAETLIEALTGTSHPILVYSSFESVRLTELAAEFPDRASDLEAIRDRLRDLLPILRRHVYFPEFRGSYSLKVVAPVLASHVTFDDLEGVADGRTAAAAMARIARGSIEPGEESDLRGALLAYCERDTLALAELHRSLRDLAGSLDV